MMTIETITAQLDRISADSWYEVSDTHIGLTINDFDGFADDWSDAEREFADADAVDAVLDWLEEHADCFEEDYCCCYYHFGDIVVEVGYTSFDI